MAANLIEILKAPCNVTNSIEPIGMCKTKRLWNEWRTNWRKKNTTERRKPQTKVSSVDFLHFRLHLKLDEVELLFVVTIILVLRILFCGDIDDWLGCGLLLLLRSILLRFGVLLLLLESLAVAAFVLLSSNVFAVGTILFKLEKSNR